MGRHYTAEQIVTIEAMHLAGESAAAIATAIGSYPASVARYLARVELRSPRRKLSERSRQRIAAWYRRGVRVEQILRTFGIGESTLYAILRAGNTPLRSPGVSSGMRRYATRRYLPYATGKTAG